jgi:hypothetical protein
MRGNVLLIQVFDDSIGINDNDTFYDSSRVSVGCVSDEMT